MRSNYVNFCCLCAAALSPTVILFGQDPLDEKTLLTKNPNSVVCSFLEDWTMESHSSSLDSLARQEDPLYLLGNTHNWCVSNLQTLTNDELLRKETGDLSLQNFRCLSFMDCSSSKEDSPTLFHQKNGRLLLTNNGSMSFFRNHAEGSGGTISADTLFVQHNYLFTTFEENSSMKNGGAIQAQTFSLSRNVSPISFARNRASLNGGAIYCQNLVCAGNVNPLFFTNNSAVNGGAICCIQEQNSSEESSLSLACNQETIFSGNSAKEKGGAIYAKHVTVHHNGPVSFVNNSAKTGGAIAIQSGGSLSIIAGVGSVLFQNNYCHDSNQNSVRRNSIYLEKDAVLSSLEARNGDILFFDPIIQESTSSTSLLSALTQDTPTSLPSLVIQTTPNCSVIFSSEKLSPEEKKDINLTSQLQQPIELKSGRLVLKDRAALSVPSFSQDPKSLLVMDAGTTLTSSEDLKLTVLSIPLHSLDHENSVSIHAPDLSIQKIFLSNSGDENFYENVALLSKDQKGIPLLTVSKGQTRPNLPNGNLSSPFGYQGEWHFSWQDSEQGQTLVADWTAKDYIPHPERRSRLVANTLWNTYSDMQAVQSIINTTAHGCAYLFGTWGSAVSNLFYAHDHSGKSADNWHHRSLGYLFGISTHSLDDHSFCLAAGQLLGKSADSFITSAETISYIAAVQAQLAIPLMKISAQACYDESVHELKTKYKSFSKEGSGAWHSVAVSGEICAWIPIVSNGSGLFGSFSIFSKLQGFSGKQDGFEESLGEARSFSESSFKNISLPIGITFEKKSQRTRNYYHFLGAYIQDLKRSAESGPVTLLKNAVSWAAPMANLDSRAWVFQLTNQRSLYRFQTLLNASCMLRGQSHSYSLDLGATYRF
ncbi:polymorphic outer membrane protein middle domain-containing protein [Chlamydia sp.]|uniref:polymorphic outer membrane protein middle domain-containing protein n=1 Tax=Chlamydia sp. TaxID=35827 RepID=UPI0025C5B318|nr:polymorphic outer membrane protein middle domain-containing protein [Chlamydia sp.]MBQ8498477.1 Pmp family polymorphic membrane protein autotransporter adhesin [Chlamydia sp.]